MGLSLDRPLTDLDRALLLAVIAFLILNRVVLAILTVPVGFSLHPSVAVLGLVTGLLALRQILVPAPLPRGATGMWGLILLTALMWMPYAHAGQMGEFEMRQFDQGIIKAVGYGALFVAVYQLSTNARCRRIILGTVLAVSAFQGAIAIFELVTRSPFNLLTDFWTALGLQLDPRGIQEFASSVNTRRSGELRAASTAPHPILLSALMALSLFVSVESALLFRGWARKFAWATAACCGLAFLTNNSRTGYLMAATMLLVFLFWHFEKMWLVGRLALVSLFGTVVVAALSPRTLRFALNLVTFRRTDNTVEVRAERIPLIMDYLEERPFFGAGYSTHSRIVEQIWDNGYLHALSEFGMVGTGVFLAFFIAALAAIWRYSLKSDETGTYARIGTLSVLALLVGGVSVDIFTFAQFMPLSLALIALGLGAVQGFTVPNPTPAIDRSRATAGAHSGRSRRRWRGSGRTRMSGAGP